MARVRSAIRRNQTSYPNQQRILVDNLEIDLVSRVVKQNEVALKLTTTEYNLLSLFARNEGKVLTHHYILKEIWGVGHQTETQYLRVYVAQLRKKIEENPNNPKFIITESGVGYRFN